MSARAWHNGCQPRQVVALAARRGPAAAAAAAGVLGAAVLAGWWLGLPVLSGGVGDWTPVSPDTAMAILLLALGLRLSEAGVRWPHARLVAGASAVAALVIAGCVVAELRAVVPFTLGDLIVPAARDARALQTGRMSLATLIDVVALGLAVLMHTWTPVRGWRPAPVAAFGALIVSSHALLAVAYGVPAFSGLTPLAPQTPPAAVAFALLSAGFVLALAGPAAIETFTHRTPAGILARRMVPASIIVPIVLGWIRLEGERRDLYTHEFGVAVMAAAAVVMLLGMTWLTALRLDASEAARRRTEETERESREHLAHAIRAGRVGLWEWNLVTGGVWYSSEWKRQIGHEEAEIGDRFAEWQSRVHPDDRDRALAQVEAYVRSDDPDYTSEFRFRHKDGSYRHILAQATEVRDSSGVRVKLVGSHVDLTEYASLQARVQQAYRLESLGRLAGGVAHDFNNLLMIINTASELLLADLPADGRTRADAQAIREAGGRAAALTGQLLAFSRQQVVVPRVLDLREVVTGFEGMLRRLLRENIDIVITVVPGAGNVRADQGQVEQVILNLAANAGDAMPGGGRLAFEVRSVDLDEGAALRVQVAPGPYVVLSVADTGEGMPEAVRARVFDPFFTTKAPGKGTGLGLATVHGIVRQSGGGIDVESAPARGTTFRVYLPRVSEPVQRAAAVRPRPERGHETVLVVEDEPGLRRVIVRMLEALGFTAVAATTGDEAIQILARHDGAIDLLLTDVVMPGLSCVDLLTRAVQVRPGIAVVCMSAYAGEAAAALAGGWGTTRLLAKPFTQADLTKAIREALAGRPGS